LVYVAATDVQEGVDDLDDAIGTVSAAVTAHTGAAAGAHDASAIALAEIVGLVADNVQAAVAALLVQVQAAQSTADNHVAAAEAAHQATAIAYTDSLELGTTTVQGAIDATIGLVGEHQNEPAGAHAATAISLEAIVGLASSNVQAGIAELLVAVQAAQGDATGAGIDAGIADALAESVATDRVCHARAGLDWSDAAGDDFSVAADQYDAIDREVYALATAGSGSQAVGLVQQVCAPQRGAILSAVRVTYKVGGTASLVVRVKGADGTVCTDTGSPPTGTSATKAALSAGDVTGCTATPGEPLDVIATCYSSAVADTCSIGHVDVAWGR
jgi:hypothetical protein